MNNRSNPWAAFLAMALCASVAVAQTTVETDEPNLGGDVDLAAQDPRVALERLHPAEGYEVNLFASEKDFPEIANPVSLTFDAEGRLWLITSTTYPHYLPGHPPDDRIVVLEDTTGDGRADKSTVFADDLYLPMGFELGDGGVYISQQPNVMFLKDTTGDGRADHREVILHGFGTEDSHHALSAFVWGPGGGLYMHEGTFHHSQVETPYGPVRLENAGVFRYEPRTEKLGVFVSYNFANPWGHVFDKWGQNFIADASNGNNYFAAPFSGHIEYPDKRPGMREFTPQKVRPTSGCEIVYSRHFPEEAQGNFLINNVIGFHGIKQHRIIDEGSGFTAEEVEPLLVSSDINFRPVDLQFGPDGALYIADWFNPLIGHMQYSIRDERRDTEHGRIWRVTYTGRDTLEPINIAELGIEEQLDLLTEYESRTRYRARQALREHPTEQVTAALGRWVARLDQSHEDHEHRLLEALWVYQHHDVVETGLLDRLLKAEDYRARAAATRVLQYWKDRADGALSRLRERVDDDAPRVRLEAVRALSFLGSAEAAEVALSALRHEMDYYLNYTLTETMRALEPHWKPALAAGEPFADDHAEGIEYILDRLGPAELANVPRSVPVLHALLSRAGIEEAVRIEALEELAENNGASVVEELIEAIERVDGTSGGGPATADLASLLVRAEPDDLATVRGEVERLSVEGRDPTMRQSAYLAMFRADGGVERVWDEAAESPGRLVDLLDAVALIEGDDLRAELYPKVEPLLEELSAPTERDAGVTGRYVRIRLPGNFRTLTLAEVQVFSGNENVALGGEARQATTAYGATADRAVDGDTEGRFDAGTSTHSNEMTVEPWWEVDLGESHPVSAVVVWNRTDGDYGQRLDPFHLIVLDEDRREVFRRDNIPAPEQSERVELDADPDALVRRAAIRAISHIPAQRERTFATLAALVRDDVERGVTVEAIGRIPREHWPAEPPAGLAEAVADYAATFPAERRTGERFGRVLALGRELAARLPEDRGQPILDSLAVLEVRTIRIAAVVAEMKFDVERFEVRPGQQIELVFENPDHMPHNLLIVAPGSLEAVGSAADAMAAEPDAFEKQFIPDTDAVLHATDLINHNETATLRFTAPTEPDEYPYVCTFPGHWRTMRGVMEVAE